MRSKWGIKTASQRSWHLGGQHMHITSFAHSLAMVRLPQTNKSRRLPTTLEAGKKRRCKILSFYFWKQWCFWKLNVAFAIPSAWVMVKRRELKRENPLSSLISSSLRISQAWLSWASCIISSLLISARVLFYPDLHWGMQYPCDFGGGGSVMFINVFMNVTLES